MVGWLGDLGRLFWGLLYWNARKSLFRLTGASAGAPCQHPSDSGAAGRTGCEACIEWRDKNRFRRLCPLLETGGDGRSVCSVSAADVRPFWGRAAAVYGGAAVFLACASVLTAFAGFRVIGYRVPLSMVAWPPAWHQIRKVRADYFYRLAVRSFDSGDVRRSYLALNQAYMLDTQNFAVARLLAQLAQIGNPDFSDAIYSRLLLDDRARLEETGEVWVRALMARGDFASVGSLAARMLREHAAHVPAWTQALLFSEKMSGDPGEVDRLLAGPVPVAAEARSVLSLAKSLRAGSPDGRLGIVRRYLGGATSAFEILYALDRLLELDRASEVAAYVEGHGGASLDPYDREALKLDAYSLLGWGDLERREMSLLLEHGASVPAVTLVASHLVRHPDARAAEYFFQQLDRHPMPVAAEYSPAHLALLCVAGVNGLGARMRGEGEAEGRIVGGSFPAWTRVRDFFDGAPRGANPAAIMPALGAVPLEMTYAVFDHYHSFLLQPARRKAPGS